MKQIKKLVVTILAVVLCVSAIMIPAMAATVSGNGLEATLTTDKEVYTQDEQITATLVVKNVSGETLENVSLKTSAPRKFVTINESKDNAQVAELKAGESVSLTVVYKRENNPATGDPNFLVIGIALMVIAAAGLVAVVASKKSMRIVMSIALCVVMVGTAAVGATVYAATNDPLTVGTTVKVDETDVTITGTVTYGEVETIPTDVQVTNGDFETGDLTGWTVLTDGWGKVDGKHTGVISATSYWAEELPYNQGGEYHLDGWSIQETSVDGVINEAAAWSVRSEQFSLAGSGFISVKMGGNAAAVKVYLADGTQIGYYKQTRFNDANFPHVGQGGSWADMGTYVIDLSNYVGQKMYIELCDEGEGAWAVAFFDDVVTYYETAPDYERLFDTVLDGHTADETPAEIKIAWTLATNSL